MIQREDATKTIPLISNDRPFIVAESDLRMRLRTFPRDAQTWYTLGSYLRSIGRFEEAEEALRKAITLNPGPTHFQEELARILMDQGRLDEAYQILDCRGVGSIVSLKDEINTFREVESQVSQEAEVTSPCVACHDYTYYGCSKGGACDSIIHWRAKIRQLAVAKSI